MNLNYAKELIRLDVEFKQIKTQRDELLEALEYLMHWINIDLTPSPKSIEAAREILAKVKGEQ